MNKILIIYPHFPPSNLAGVHRPRLFAQHLSAFGWQPVILTVDEKFYEEPPDKDIVKLLDETLRIEKVTAFKRRGPVGDLGLRSFFQLYKKAKALIKKEQFDFLFIPIPSFYCALLGRWLHDGTGIKYGIDYIDPWVHIFPGSNKIFSRHWLSTKLAKILEPMAVKKASLITGVAKGYYEPVLERNPHLRLQAVTGAMPYGGEENDHRMAALLNKEPYLFKQKENVLKMVYAGTMLPKAYKLLEEIFIAIAGNLSSFHHIEFHFIGTGKASGDATVFNIKPLAERHGLWNSIVFEYPGRIPYLDVLVHLNAADAIFVLGSTEPHYTPSKVYQGILSAKPILAVLHKQSTAVKILEESNGGVVLTFDGEQDLDKIKKDFVIYFNRFKCFIESFQPAQVNKSSFDEYSAFAVTKMLAGLLDTIKGKNEKADKTT